MTRSPSSDAPHDGSSTGATLKRAAASDRRVGMQVPKIRAAEMLRILRLLALAIVTIVCAGVTSPGRGLAIAAAPVDVAAPDSANPIWGALARQPQQWRDRAAPVERDVLEVEIDDDTDDDDIDDDDTRSDVADHPAVALRGVRSPRKPAGALRGTPSVDTSHFAIGDGFPRGPPA